MSQRAGDADGAEAIGPRPRPLLIPLVLLFLTVGIGVPFTLHVIHENDRALMEMQARDVALIVATQIAKEREAYTDAVAPHVTMTREQGETAAFGHSRIPLPATFVREVADRIAALRGMPYRYRLISRWNLNPRMGVSDEFEQRGFAALERQEWQARNRGRALDSIEWQPYFEVIEEEDRVELRGLFADRASHERCVSCHNTEETRAWSPEPGELDWVIATRTLEGIKGPKRFELGSLMGAVSVRVDMAHAARFLQSYSRRYALAMGGFGLLLLSAGVLLFLSWSRALTQTNRQLAQQTQDLEAGRDRLDAFFQIATAFEDRENLEKTFEMLLQFCKRLGYDMVLLSLVDAEAGVIRATRGLGGLEDLVGKPLCPVGSEHFLARAVSEGKTVTIPDVADDPRGDGSLLLAWGVRGQIVLPLRSSQVLGVLQAASRKVLHPQPEDVRTLETLASQAARALSGLQALREIRRLNRALEERNEKLEQLAVDLQKTASSEREASRALKEAQSQLIQSEKLASLGQIVAGVAHEINNPLAYVINNTAILERDLQSMRYLLSLYVLAEQQPELYARIHEFSKEVDIDYALSNVDDLLRRSRDGLSRIRHVVDDLRDFARVDQAAMQVADLNAGIESTANILRGLATRRGVELILELGTVPAVLCHATKINQVVLNLIANAIDACKRGDRVVVRSTSDGAQVTIEVQDTGCGIDPGIMEKVYDPFFTTKPPGQGTGLGLAISYGIVKDHGGRIAFESRVGKGSTFRITLPVRPPTEREAASSAAEPEASPKTPPGPDPTQNR